jgi:hypothetical protein
MTLLGASGLLLSVSGDRGGFLRRPVAAVRAAPGGEAVLRRGSMAGGTP